VGTLTEIDPGRAAILGEVAARFGTPCYVYFARPMRERLHCVEKAFSGHFAVSFAMKCNPNIGLLRALLGTLKSVDASSGGEVRRAIQAGYSADQITFSGPAKRAFEIEYAVSTGCGAIVCESERQIEVVDEAARRHGRRQPVLIRINPNRVAKRFGLQMGGRPSQFGIDEDVVDDVLDRLPRFSGLQFAGLHVFSGGNSLDGAAIAENLLIIAELFEKLVSSHSLAPSKLVFGSGFGIPYFAGDEELDLASIAATVNPVLVRLRGRAGFERCRFVLEMGRWLAGPDGFLLTSVVDAKASRGTNIRLCDAGFNNHLSACGMMGTVMRRNWRFWNLSRLAQPASEQFLLVGPLCASFDVLGTNVDLPPTEPGDIIAIGSSGAYGLTASPTRFISHPEPREVLVEDTAEAMLVDVTETTAHQLDQRLDPNQDYASHGTAS
jgi:diaminopimelate decarboxylase